MPWTVLSLSTAEEAIVHAQIVKALARRGKVRFEIGALGQQEHAGWDR